MKRKRVILGISTLIAVGIGVLIRSPTVRFAIKFILK